MIVDEHFEPAPANQPVFVWANPSLHTEQECQQLGLDEDAAYFHQP
jgi:hypothetical protein